MHTLIEQSNTLIEQPFTTNFVKYNVIPMHNFTMVATVCHKWLHGEALRTSAGMIRTIGIFEAALISLLAEAE